MDQFGFFFVLIFNIFLFEIVWKFKNFLYKIWHRVVYLQKTVEVASITDVS